ncbi:transcription factor bHLH [Tripterygium wilfordii]|uniref:Transcription factor bHLH n=1 Tax=Tripterygium wilfordii TaxID=458696 RepID=A0A7J7CVM8_TRIWF|nr:transcription factor bHLH121-like [Tripterygium wilfordii]KAF5738121.1 transcription factor bHLH [Tripterygium wilfordii]
MDQWQTSDLAPSTSLQSFPEPRQRTEATDAKDPVAARKVQKADREKLRRDRLNEQFLELGNTLDPDRPKNDKATILTDTVQVLKDLTAEVNRLKAECAVLSEESRELMQEKNELREEKASLKSDIENLNIQYQQRVRVMFPWAAVDPSVVMAPPYSYPVPVPVPPGSIPMHPSLQPFPFFGNQNPGAIATPCSTFIQYPTAANAPVEQPSTQFGSASHISSKQDSKSKSSEHHRGGITERCDDSDNVATDLELKMPGSSTQQDLPTGERKGKQLHRKEKHIVNRSSSSRYSSSQSLQDSSSNSVGDVPKAQ